MASHIWDGMTGWNRLKSGLASCFWAAAGAGLFTFPVRALESRVPSSPTVALSSDAVQGDVYIIGPGDQLQLNLFDAPELSGPLDVLSDGSVSLPLVGSVVLSGLTLQQASS